METGQAGGTMSYSEMIRPRAMRITSVLLSLLSALSILLSCPDRASCADEIESPILSEEELAWITAHPTVAVGNEMDWPPFDFSEKKESRGYSIDLLRLLGRKTGLKFQFVNGYTWSELLTRFQEGELSVLPAIMDLPERRTFTRFTSHYYVNATVLVVRDTENSTIRSLNDVRGQKVAVVESYYYEDTVRLVYPNIEVVGVRDFRDGLEAVQDGRVKAFVGSRAVVLHTIKEHFLAGLRIAGLSGIDDPEKSKLRMGVRKDEVILWSILEKGLSSVTADEFDSLRSKWLFPDRQSSTQETDAGLLSFGGPDWMLWGGGLLVLLLGALAWALIRFFKEDQVAAQFGSPRFRWFVVGGLAAVVAGVILLAGFALEQNRQALLGGIQANLEASLGNTVSRLKFWEKSQQHSIEQMGKNVELIAITKQLLSMPSTQDMLAGSPHQSDARAFFRKHDDENKELEFILSSPTQINIAASRHTDIGMRNPIAARRPDLFARALEGRTVFVLPVKPDEASTTEEDASKPSLFFAAPVTDEDGSVIAVLTQRLDPAIDFSAILQTDSLGETGENYAFDQQGSMLSESRFIDDVRNIGLISPSQHVSLAFEIRDPGGNLMQGFNPPMSRLSMPLTRMAESATKGEPGVDMNGYRNYRGVPVFGSWIWLHKQNLGLAMEVEVDEALAPLRTMRSSVMGVLGITILLSVGATLLTLLLGERANRAFSTANDELEIRVQERTRAFEEADDRSRLLLESVGEGIFGVDHNGRVNFTNLVCSELLGFEPGELIGRQIHSLIHHSRADGTPYPEKECPIFLSYTKGVIGQRDDEVLWRKDGSGFSAEYTSRPIRKDAELVGSVVVFHDISARKRAEELLNRQSAALQAAANAIIITDAEGIIQWVNPAFTSLTGYRDVEVIGKNPRILNSRTHERDFFGTMWRTIKDGRVWQGELTNRRKDGSLFHEEMTVAPVLNAKGEIVNFAAVKQDITDRKRAEEQIRSFAAELQEKNAELDEALATAEEASIAKGQFLANMSHEIRTPINGVIGMTELLLDTELNQDQYACATTVLISAESLLSIINDILDFSKIESGKLEFENIDFNLRTLLEEVLEVLAVNATKMGLELILDMPDSVPQWLRGDPGRLRQILNNLANNALKFTESGEVCICVESQRIVDSSVTLRFRVSDTGIGISKDQIASLFRAFSQADASTTRKFGGTGLGLTISKQLTNLMGGEIGVDSIEGHGSTFWFTLALEMGVPADDEFDLEPNEMRGRQILILDSNATSRKVLCGQLESWGCQCHEAEDTEGIVERLERIAGSGMECDSVFISEELLGRERESSDLTIQTVLGHLDVPLIILTRTGRQSQTEETTGAIHLGKPVKQSALYNCLLDVFSLHIPRAKERAASTQKGETTRVEGERTVHVLVVDDNAVNRKVAVRLLEKLGYSADAVEDGKEVLNALQQNTYDLVLMDCQMPEMDGYQATAAVRNEEGQNEHILIIAMTAHAMKGDREKCLDAGMDDYLTKPIRTGDLEKMMAKHGVSPEGAEQIDGQEEGISEVFDGAAVLKGIDGDVELLSELTDILREDAPALLDDIRYAVETLDYSRVQEAAHKLKGMASNFSAKGTVEAAGVLEQFGRENDPSHLEGALANLISEYERLEEALSSFFTNEEPV